MSSNRSGSGVRRASSTSVNQRRTPTPPTRNASLSKRTEMSHSLPQPPIVSQDSQQYQKLRQQQHIFLHHSQDSSSSNNLAMPVLVMPTPPPVEPESSAWSAEQALSMAARQTTLTPNLGIGRSSKSIRRLSANRPLLNQTMQLGLGGELQHHLQQQQQQHQQQQQQQPSSHQQQPHPLPVPTHSHRNRPPVAVTPTLSPVTSPDLPDNDLSQRRTSTGSQEGEKRPPPLPARHSSQSTGSPTTTATGSTPSRTPSSAGTSTQRSLFLQFGKVIKRVPFPEGTITIATINSLFMSKFQCKPSGDNMPIIRIRDPSAGVFYELEDVRDIRDKSVLRMDISMEDPMDQIRRRMDLGFAAMTAAISDIRTRVAGQSDVTQSLKTQYEQILEEHQQQRESFEKTLTDQLQQQQEVLLEQRSVVTIAKPTTKEVPSPSPTNVEYVAEAKGLKGDVRKLRDELASVQLAYSVFRTDTTRTVEILETKCRELHDALENQSIQSTGSARTFIAKSQADMDTRTEAIASRIEVAEEAIEDFKRDLTQRRAMPSKTRMRMVSETLTQTDKELNELLLMLEETRPKWKQAWETELQEILNEQQFLKDQEELLQDLRADRETMATVYDQLEQIVQLKSKQPSIKRTNIKVVSADNGQQQLNQVLQEIGYVVPDSDKRLKALEQVEKLRKIENENRVDPFEAELGEFVSEKKLRPTGGAEEVERRREQRNQETLRAMLESMAKR